MFIRILCDHIQTLMDDKVDLVAAGVLLLELQPALNN
jgi:hypothetical protein